MDVFLSTTVAERQSRLLDALEAGARFFTVQSTLVIDIARPQAASIAAQRHR